MDNLILNRYKPIAQAGSGGFGVVILAWDTRMQRKVAIKCISFNNQNTDNGQATNILDANKTQILNNSNTTSVINNSLKNHNAKIVDESGEHWSVNMPGLEEARTAALIQDANIVTVYDFEVEDNTAYIIMEYVDGITLSDFLEKYKNEITLDMITCIASGISHALKLAHSNNVFHLDIKPDNVLIDKSGKVKVTDFGLATLANDFGYGTAEAGTIGYMPPEQMKRQALDCRSDLWSLACVIYEMLCDINPFDGDTIIESLDKINNFELNKPSLYWEGLNTEVDTIIFKALSKDIDNRYDSVLEFYDLLSTYLTNPKAGKRQISNLLKNQTIDDTLAIEKPAEKKKKFVINNSFDIILKILTRVFSAISSVVITYIASINIEYFRLLGDSTYQINSYGLIAICIFAILSAVFPTIGIILSFVLICVALFFAKSYIVCFTLLAILIIWFVLIDKKETNNVNALSSFVIFGSFGFTQIAPFICGIFCKTKNCILNTILGISISIVFASLWSRSITNFDLVTYVNLNFTFISLQNIQDFIIKFLTNYSNLIICISWLFAAILISIFNNFNSSALKVFISILSGGIIVFGVCIYNYINSEYLSWQPQGFQLLPVVLATICAIIVVILKPNYQNKNN